MLYWKEIEEELKQQTNNTKNANKIPQNSDQNIDHHYAKYYDHVLNKTINNKYAREKNEINQTELEDHWKQVFSSNKNKTSDKEDDIKYPIYFGHTSMKGRRHTMEDEFVVDVYKQWQIFAVFDGHSGFKAAQIVANQLVAIFSEEYDRFVKVVTLSKLQVRCSLEFVIFVVSWWQNYINSPDTYPRLYKPTKKSSVSQVSET